MTTEFKKNNAIKSSSEQKLELTSPPFTGIQDLNEQHLKKLAKDIIANHGSKLKGLMANSQQDSFQKTFFTIEHVVVNREDVQKLVEYCLDDHFQHPHIINAVTNYLYTQYHDLVEEIV